MSSSDHAPVARPSIGALLREQANALGEREFLRFEGRRATFAEIESESNRLGSALRRNGVERGDRVAIMLPNGLEFPIAWLAVLKVGAAAVSANVQYRDADLSYVLRDSGAALVVTDTHRAELVLRVAKDCPGLRTVGVIAGEGSGPGGVVDLRREMNRADPSCELAPVGPDDLANIQYTSGTTGFPKGCMLTHRYWLTVAEQVASHVQLSPEDVVLTAQPFYYMDPLWNTVMCLAVGVPLVVLPRFSASTFWKAVTEHDVTFFYCLGTMPVILLKQEEAPEIEKAHRVRLVLCSGIVPQLHAAMEARWGCPWREVYGSTELGGVLAVPPEDEASIGTGSIGAPMLGRRVKLADENGREVRDGDEGELWVWGEPRMLGYYNRPDASHDWSPDGWARTGDIMVRDANGTYRMVGRIKDMIRRGGENIAAAEVEGVLCEHPAVYAAACVPIPDDVLGEEVKAFVQLKPDAASQSTTPQEIVDFASERLAVFKVPRFIEFVDEMPLTPSERIEKPALLARTEDHRATAYDARAPRR